MVTTANSETIVLTMELSAYKESRMILL